MIEYMPREKTRNADTIKRLARSSAMRPLDAASRVQRDAGSIAIAMQEIHGGRWRVQIDHLAGLVMIVRH